MEKYEPKKIEEKWQKKWLEEKTYEPNLDSAKKPFFNLMMFPYPSAEGLHVGNMYTFTGVDVYGRFQRMKGNDVFEPIGLDGFGIHSENYAMKVGTHPMEQAKISEKRFYEQLRKIGNGFAWDEHLETYDPEYYRWTQWIFVQMWKRGLAYRKKQSVNWCPKDLTVLADEQVENGKCERCGSVVEKRELEQWFFRITNYADRLLGNLKTLDWAEKIKIAQTNWIGKSEGAEIDFRLNWPMPEMDVVFATNNQGKMKRMQKLFAAAGLRVTLKTPADIGIKDFDVIEDGKTLAENAEKKARAVAALTDMPVFADDTGFFIEGAEIDPVTVKRNALAGADEKSLTVEEIAARMQKYYAGIANAHGGKVDAEWRQALCFITPEKIAVHGEAVRPVVLTDVTEGAVDPHLPLRGMYISKVTGKHALEETEEEEIQELQPITDTIKKLFTPSVKIFTTRPDTLFGATYLVLAPEHPFVRACIERKAIGNAEEVSAYLQSVSQKTETMRQEEGAEKTGVELTGVKAINPATGKEIPIWVADYVLGNYGTGAIMAVPAHDKRDFEFAKKFNLAVMNVLEPETGEQKPDEEFRKSIVAVVEDPKTGKFLTLNWGPKFGGQLFVGGGIEYGEDAAASALREIKEETGYANVKFVAQSEKMHHHYFAFSKGVARKSEVTGLHFRLMGDEQTESHLENHESEKFTVEWLDAKEILDRMEDENHLLVFRRLVLGEIYTGYGRLVNSEKFDGMDSKKAKWEITEFAGGVRKTTYRLRDWLISRQRYWGPPIPMIFCETCAKAGKGEKNDMPGWYAVPENELPIKLPYAENFRPTGSGVSPLATVREFYETKCPGCGGAARRETDVSDTFLDSAWYFLRYPSVRRQAIGDEEEKKGGEAAWDSERTKRWLPVNSYIGGAEHAVLHLLYSRFVTMVLHDAKFLDFEEPFTRFRANGLVVKDGAKMSKSKGNVINPDEYIENFGADTLRMYLMFMAPFEDGGDFRDQAILGIERFLVRVWKMANDLQLTTNDKGENSSAKQLLHKTIKKVTGDIEELHYNTAISALMILLRGMEEGSALREDLEMFAKLLAPFAPHITEEIWRETLGNKTSIHHEPWPIHDPALIKEETVSLVLQVNSRTRDAIAVPADVTEEEAKKFALSSEKVRIYLKDAEPKKIIYVPGKLVNIVV